MPNIDGVDEVIDDDLNGIYTEVASEEPNYGGWSPDERGRGDKTVTFAPEPPEDDNQIQEPPPPDPQDQETLPTGPRPPLSLCKKIIIGSGHILNDLCASLWFSYLLLYFQKVVQFDSNYAAGLLFLGQIVDGLATPFVGYEADNSGGSCFSFLAFCKNYGRCKSWHLVGVIMVITSFPFIFSPTIGYGGILDMPRFIYYAPFIALFQIGWASTQISHLALIPKMDPDPLIRTQMLAIRYAFTVASNVIIFGLTWYSLGFSVNCEIDPSDWSTFRNVALVAIGIGLLFSITFHLNVVEETDSDIKRAVAHLKEEDARKDDGRGGGAPTTLRNRNLNNRRDDARDGRRTEEFRALLSSSPTSSHEGEEERHQTPEPDHEDDVYFSRGSSRMSLSTKLLSLGREKMSTIDWMTLPQFYIVAFIYMSSRLCVNLTQVYMPLYLDESLKLPCGTVATIPLTMYISGFILSLFMKLLNKYLGRQLAYLIGVVLSLAGSIYVLNPNWNDNEYFKSYGIYGVAALLGGGASALLITSLSICADMIGNNVENGAFVYGSMSFADKLSSGAAVLIINSIIPCQKDDDASCNSSLLIPYYRKVLGYSCGGSAISGIIGVIILTILIYFNEKKRLREVRRQLAQDLLFSESE